MFAISRRPANLASRHQRRNPRTWTLEGLEARTLLSGSPSVYMVSDPSDSSTDTGSLPYAIIQANADPNPAGSLIQFDPAVFSTPQTITLASTLKLSETAGPEVIDGPGASLATVSGNKAVRVLQVDGGVTASISGLTIAGGNDPSGGGINNSGTLSITDSTFSGNSASGGSGGYFGGAGSGGAISNSGTLAITDSTFSGNSALLGGYGGFHLSVGASGGGIYNSGTLSITDSTFSGNSATGSHGGEYAGGGHGGGIDNDGTLSITDSTFSGNSASGGSSDLGLGYGGRGGGIDNDGTLSITDSTFSGNSATGGSGGYFGYGSGGGIYVEGIAVKVTGNPSVTTINSIFQNAQGGNVSVESGGTFRSLGHNLFSDAPSFALDATDLVNPDPLLGPLADNGGPTMTMALLPGSPAIDAGVSVPDVATDQRGILRSQGIAPDIGAFESRGFTLAIASGDNQVAGVLAPFAAPLVLVVASPFGEPVAGGRVSFAAPATGPSAGLTANVVTLGPDGRASVQAVANSLAGTYTITAKAAGGDGVAFTLINGLPPTVVGMQYLDVARHPATLVLSFSRPMDAASAQDLANYRLVGAGGDHRLGSADDRVIPILGVQYDAASQSVLLRLGRRLSPHQTVGLTLVGAGPGGLTSAVGTPLAGSGPGRPGTGSDFTVQFTGQAAEKPMRFDLLPDGGFETPKVLPTSKARTLSAGNRALAPWRITAGSVDVQSYWPAVEGTHTLDLNGVSAGTIEQSFATIPGQVYQLLFDYANNPDRPARRATASVTVTGDGTLLSTSIAHTDSTPTKMKYARFLETFVADSATTTVRFASTTRGSFGIILDGVSVSALSGGSEATPA